MLRNRRLKVAIVTATEVPADVEQEYKSLPIYNGPRSEPLADYPFYWDADDWNLKTGDLILDFLSFGGSKVDKIECYGVCRVQAVTDSGLVPVEKVRKPLRMRLLTGDREKLANIVMKLVRDGVLKISNQLISINNFTNVLAKQAITDKNFPRFSKG